jgi:hypothetical protein
MDDERREQSRARKRRRTDEKKLEEISLLDFTRQVVELTVKKHSETYEVAIPQRDVGSSLTSSSLQDVRHDQGRHLIKFTDLRGVCKHCKKRTQFRCDRCNVALHPECFYNFHMPEEMQE